jgi:hypothetical protein
MWKERKRMNLVKLNVILTVVTAIFCVPAAGLEEPTLNDERVLLTSQPDPALVGIDKLHVIILRSNTEPNTEGLTWEELETKIIDQLNKADANLNPEIPDNLSNIPELRIYTNALKLEDSQQYVFHIQTSLARAVRLTKSKSPILKANVWQSSPVMQAISEENMTEEITNLVSEQVDFFIHAYQAANPPEQKTTLEKQTESSNESVIVEYKYVASKSSNIFHRPDCRWAKNISPENLVKYKSREEAIKAGKRPCKSCRP